MAPRKLSLLLVPLIVFALMAVALVLVVRTGAFDDREVAGDRADSAEMNGDAAHGDGETASRGATRSQRPGSITGDVRVLATRAAAADREVVLTFPDNSVRALKTDADGGFTFGNTPPGGPYELRVEGSDHAPVLRLGLWLTPSQRLDVGTLWLADGVRVRVEVRSFDGRPLPDAVVRAFTTGSGSTPFDSLRDPTPVAAARSGSDGWAHFEGLPPGTWTITAERAGYARRGLIGVTVRDGVDEEAFHVALERGYRLHGRVLDRGGAPVRGATVLAIRRTLVSDATTAALAQRTVTDRDGFYSFAALPAADVVLWSGWPGGRLAVLAAVRVPGVEELDLTLLRGSKLVGRVTSLDDGVPIDGARVDVNVQVLGAFTLSFRSVTNTNGEYVVKIPMPGTITWISVSARGYVNQQPQVGDNGEIVAPSGATVTIDVPLAPGGVVSGRVTGPDGPIEGAEVGATNPNWYFSTFTDRQGRYTLSGLPDQRFFIVASKWGHVMPGLPADADSALTSGTAPPEFVVELGPGVDVTVDLSLVPGVSIRGRVENADGTPATGALVEIPFSGAGTHASADGSFELGPVDPGEHELAASLEGAGRHAQTIRIPANGEPAEDITLRLPPGVRVTGRLLSKAGRALDGAYVQITPWDGSIENPITDEWNWLESTRLPVAADGTFDHPLLLESGDFYVRGGALGHRRTGSGRIAIVPGREHYQVDLSLEDGATFSGRITNFDGAPVPRAFVSALRVREGTSPTGVDYPGAWGPPISAVADQNGVFRIEGLDVGPHVFRAWADGHIADAQTLSVPEASGAVFELIEWMSISGRVLFTDGQPASGAMVRAAGGEYGDQTESRTDDDGRFFVTGLSRGDYVVTISGAPGSALSVVRREIDVAAGTVDVAVEVEHGSTISGTVTDTDGVPIAGAQVSVGDAFAATSAVDGSFALRGLGPGTYTLNARSDTMETVGEFAARGVAAGATDVQLRLPRAALLAGVLVDDQGRPMEARQLRFTPIDVGGVGDVLPYPRDAQAEQRGEFSVYVAPATKYRALLPDDAAWTLPPNTIVVAGTSVVLQATRGASITGRVLGSDGTAASGVQVYAAGEGSTRYTETADDGRFTVSGLHAGERYTLMINSAGWSLDDALTLEAPTTGVLVTASRNHPLSGRIVDARGEALGGASVRVVHKQSGSSWMFATGDDGRFSIGGVPEGPCEVYVDARGEGNETLAGTLEAGTLDADLRVEN